MDATWERLAGVSVLRCLRCGLPLAILEDPDGSSAAAIEALWEAHWGDVAALAREHHCLGRRAS